MSTYLKDRVDKKTVLNWNKASFTGMRSELDSVPWQDLFRNRSAEEKWEAFKGHLTATVNRNVPVKPAGPLGRPP